MISHRGARALLLGILMHAAPSLLAQSRRPVLEVTAPLAPGVGATIAASNLFAEGDMRELIRSGFPAQLHFRVELWRSAGLFDNLEAQVDWQLVVQYDAASQRYRVLRRQNGKVDDAGSFATLSTALVEIERPVRTMIAPQRAGTKYYYTLALDIEALSVSDMDQLERWLRGVRGNTAAGAVGSGLRTLMLRMLGGERKHLSAKSAVFIAVN